MLRQGTVFVVGAGASCEAGDKGSFPSGKQLMEQILNTLKFPKSDDIKGYSSTDQNMLRQAFFTVKSGNPNSTYGFNEYISACAKISGAMSISPSIDNFIDAHKDDKDIEICGKLAIASCILQAERLSKLSVKSQGGGNDILYSLKDTWYARLFTMICEAIDLSNVDRIFDRLSFIVFNYDRNIEYFFYNALRAYYCLSCDRAAKIMSTLNIIHPYGVVGNVDYSKGTDGMWFARDLSISVTELVDAVKSIRTFTERIEDSEFISKIGRTISSANTLVFMGFAYHHQNMNLIMPDKSNVRRLYGTGLGMSDSNVDEIKQNLHGFLSPQGKGSGSIYIRKTECTNLLGEFSMSLTDNNVR